MREPKLLVGSAYGTHIPFMFVKLYKNNVDNADSLKEEIEICSQDPNEVEDPDDYWMCWGTIVSEATVGGDVLVHDGDLWAMSPEEAANWEYI